MRISCVWLGSGRNKLVQLLIRSQNSSGWTIRSLISFQFYQIYFIQCLYSSDNSSAVWSNWLTHRVCVRVSTMRRSTYSSQRRNVFQQLVATLRCGWLVNNRSGLPLLYTAAVSVWPSTPLTTWHLSTGLKLPSGQHLTSHVSFLLLRHVMTGTVQFMHTHRTVTL